MDNSTENDNTNDPNTLSTKTVETVENLNGHRNEKKRLKNVWLQEKTKFKSLNQNRKIEMFVLRLLLIRV